MRHWKCCARIVHVPVVRSVRWKATLLEAQRSEAPRAPEPQVGATFVPHAVQACGACTSVAQTWRPPEVLEPGGPLTSAPPWCERMARGSSLWCVHLCGTDMAPA